MSGIVSARLTKMIRDLRSETLARQLVAGAIGNLALNVTTVLANLGVVVVLGHTLGASGYGVFAFATAWATLATVPAVLGLPPLVIRKVAEYELDGAWTLVRGLLRRTTQVVVVVSVLAVVVGGGVGWLVDRSNPELVRALWLSLLLVPFVGVLSVRQAVMQGIGRVVLGRLPAAVVTPILFLAGVGATVAVRGDLSPVGAVALNVAAGGVALAIGVYLLARCLPEASRKVTPTYESRLWLRSALPLVAFSGIQTLSTQASVVLLGFLATSSETGVYSAAARAAGVISFLLVTIRYPVAPTIARLHASADVLRLQQVVARSAQSAFFLTLPLALGMLVFAGPLLRLFGAGFAGGASVLRILALGQLVNVVTGLAGNVLVMTGYERSMTKGVAIGAAVGLILNVALIPLWGAVGAAIATSAGVAVTNLVLVRFAWRTLNIYAPAIRLWRLAR